MRPTIWLLLLAAAAPTPLRAQTPASVKQMAHARVKLAEQMTADPQLRKALAAKNAERESDATRDARDRDWSRNPASSLRKELSSNACAQRLRELIAPDPLVVEAILMDERGSNVCVSRETSDYWQGDEDKWRKPFLEGRAAFVEEPAFDQSSATYAVQLSVPVSEGSKPVGALTLTLKVRKEAAAPSR